MNSSCCIINEKPRASIISTKTTKKEDNVIDCGMQCSGEWIQLTKIERRLYGKHRPAGLESRFEATCPQTLQLTLARLQRRANAIVRANPWLIGRIRREPGTRRHALWIPTTSSETEEDFFRIVTIEGHDFNQHTDEIAKEANCETGEDSYQHQTPLVKLRVFHSTDSQHTQFLLTLSICHQIADATSLYELWGMLQDGAPIRSLNPQRFPNYKGHWLTAMKGTFSKRKFIHSLLKTEGSPLQAMIKNKRKVEPIDCSKLIRLSHTIRSEWIEEQKAQHTPTDDVPFVSTQDVVTSWYMSTFQPSCGALVVNLRNRSPAPITSQHVGNYLDLLVLYPHEYEDPAQIRRLVSTMGAAASPHPLNKPGHDNRLLGTVSCWHSMYQDVQFPACTRHSHLPLRGGMFSVESNDSNSSQAKPNSRMALTLFRTSLTEVAIMGFAPQPLKGVSLSSLDGDACPLGAPLVR